MSKPTAPRQNVATRPHRRAGEKTTAERAARPPSSGPVLLLIGVVVVLNLIGVVMVLSASSVVSLSTYGSAWKVFERQLLWTAIGAVAFFVAFRLDYRRWQQWALPLTVVAVGLCAVVLLPNVGIMVGGSRRWLGVGWMRFQPSELAKLAVLVFSADLLTRRRDDLGDWRAVLRPILMVFGTLAALVYIEPDLDSTVVLALITVAVLIAGGIRMRHLGAMAGLGLAAVAIMAVAEPYRRARVFTFLHPTADASNAGYQIVQSLIAFGSGGVTGVGLGAGRAKWHFLPNAHTDFVFSIIGEELGLIGCLLVLAMFLGFAVFGVAIALRATDRFGVLLAAGITVWVTAQAAINIGGVTGLLPVSGIPLPFVSFGGSSLVVTMLAAGILASVGRVAAADPAPRPPAR
ncbi:MAG: putative lipid II flippase FtsW [Actinobacteria bacterium]|nr:putative lipid II flippase FtsW [Actinomycetota bacterium]